MTQNITKVKKFGKRILPEFSGWERVRTDIQTRIEELTSLLPVVERKIAANEPWPGTQSPDQKSEAATV
jgi:hypothetical protein